MNLKTDLEAIEALIVKYSPEVAAKLRPPQSEKKVKNGLAIIKGETKPLFDLYRWHDGVDPKRWQTGDTHHFSYGAMSFFPKSKFYFLDLQTALAHFDLFSQVEKSRPAMASGAGRYFPMFFGGALDYICLDLSAEGKGRIVLCRGKSKKPFVEAYPGFDDFLRDIIDAISRGWKLTCFQVNRTSQPKHGEDQRAKR